MASENDKEILNHIFNPLLPSGELDFDTEQDDENTGLSSDTGESISELAAIAKALELEGIKAAEAGDLDSSIQLFTRAIESAPERPSAYNNRAQSFRLLNDVPAAFTDLNNAINFSEGKGRTACQAYCQRGLLKLRDNNTEEAKADFEEAAKLGSRFAKAQLVQLNPYAALCNKMLRDVVSKMQRGERT